MDEDGLPRQLFDTSFARSVAEGGRVEQLKFRPGHKILKAFLGCTAQNPDLGCTAENPDLGCTAQNPDLGCTAQNPDLGCTTQNPDLGCTALQSGGCHEEGASGGTAFWDILELTGHIKLITWPEIQQRCWNTRWTGRPDGTLLTMLYWN
eukprot:349912-Chlamydomonas_euryale.AAC.16